MIGYDKSNPVVRLVGRQYLVARSRISFKSKTLSNNNNSSSSNNNNNNNNIRLISVKSQRSNATQQAVTQDSNDKPKLSRRTATRSQTRPVCNKGITQFLPATHTRTIVSVLVLRQPPFDRYQVVLLGDRGT